MLVLAVDTSGRNGSIALARCSESDACTILELAELAGGAFSAQLIPQIAALLSHQGLTKSDIEAFAVVCGPGSFTGLRVGLAAIKALGEILAKPIAALSLLEVVARAGENPCLAAIDAGRSEVYAAEFDGQKIRWQRLLTLQEFLTYSRDLPIVTPDTSIVNVARRAGLSVQEIPRPRADAAACLGWKKIQARELTSPEELEANYIRRADAEIFSLPK